MASPPLFQVFLILQFITKVFQVFLISQFITKVSSDFFCCHKVVCPFYLHCANSCDRRSEAFGCWRKLGCNLLAVLPRTKLTIVQRCWTAGSTWCASCSRSCSGNPRPDISATIRCLFTPPALPSFFQLLLGKVRSRRQAGTLNPWPTFSKKVPLARRAHSICHLYQVVQSIFPLSPVPCRGQYYEGANIVKGRQLPAGHLSPVTCTIS